MGTDEDEPTGAEYFTVHAGIALDDVRDRAAGFDAVALAALVDAAERFAREVRELSSRMAAKLCQTCAAPLWRETDAATMCTGCLGKATAARQAARDAREAREATRPVNWADMGSSERDLWEDMQARAAAKRDAKRDGATS